MKKLNRKGFTLVELLAVIVILAIVIGIAIPTVTGTMNASKKKGFETAVANAASNLQKQYDTYVTDATLVESKLKSFIESLTAGKSTAVSGDTLTTIGLDKNNVKTAYVCKTTGGRIGVAVTAVPNGSNYRTPDEWTFDSKNNVYTPITTKITNTAGRVNFGANYTTCTD